jgi:DNA (cytosine-5)-methyltransferase 1
MISTLPSRNERPATSDPAVGSTAWLAVRFKAADLYCCAGGAGMGLSRAGFDVEGWDIKAGLSYPFKRHIGNALDADLTGFDFVWASPPCQAHTALKHVTGKEYECYIERTREKLKAWGGLYIIENVMGAPLENPVMLCGSSFGLRVRRHRIFESNVPLTVPACNHAAQPEPIDVSGTGSAQLGERKKKTGGKCRKPKNLDEAREIMGMPWATRKEIAQAIPPAFAEYLARQIMGALTAAND